jgi:hypothetical protein
MMRLRIRPSSRLYVESFDGGNDGITATGIDGPPNDSSAYSQSQSPWREEERLIVVMKLTHVAKPVF